MHQISLRGALIVGFALFAILLCTTYLINSWREDAQHVRAKEDAAKQAEKAPPEAAKAPAGEPPPPREDPAVQEERRVLAQARLQAIRGLQRDISESIDKLEQEVIAWETRTPELLKGNDGKRIAASKARTEQFAAATEKPRATRAQVKAMRERLDLLIKPIDRALLDANTSYFPSESIVSDLEKIGEESRAKLRDIREVKAVIDALQADSAAAAPADKSLQATIDEMAAQKVRERAQAVAKAKHDAFERETKRLADAEAKAEQDLANARLALLKEKTDAAREKIEQAAANEKLQAALRAEEEKRLQAKKKLGAKFDQSYPAMQGYLVPFTSPGFKQVSGNNLVADGKKGPMSLSKMRPLLRRDARVMNDLVRLMWFNNDRPKGAFPEWRGEIDQDTVGRIQDFLTEFGEIMVDRKLLLP